MYGEIGAQVMIKTLDVLRSVYDELKDKSTMVTPLQIGSQLVDWTDPQKVMCVPLVHFRFAQMRG